MNTVYRGLERMVGRYRRLGVLYVYYIRTERLDLSGSMCCRKAPLQGHTSVEAAEGVAIELIREAYDDAFSSFSFSSS